MSTGLRTLVLAALIAFATALPIGPAFPQGTQQVTYDFEIPAGSLEEALRKIAQQRNLQILFAPEDVKGLTTAGAKGRMSTQQALDALLKGTNLVVTSNGSDTFAVKPAPKDKTTDL